MSERMLCGRPRSWNRRSNAVKAVEVEARKRPEALQLMAAHRYRPEQAACSELSSLIWQKLLVSQRIHGVDLGGSAGGDGTGEESCSG